MLNSSSWVCAGCSPSTINKCPQLKEDCEYRLIDEQKFYQPNHIVSAFTVAEIGKMLPRRIKNDFLVINKEFKKWEVDYKYEQQEFMVISDKTLANAMAKMLIYLLENKLI